MQTSTTLIARQSSAMLPRQPLQHSAQPHFAQLPRLRPVSGRHAARTTGHRQPLPQCTSCKPHVSRAAASYSDERSEPMRHIRGWNSTQPGSRFRCGSAVAASDADDSTAVELYSSSDASSSDASSSSSDASSSDAEAVTPPNADTEGSVATIQQDMPRRSMQVTFTCDKCGARTARMVNPLAWDKGLVLAQCSGCEAWHKLRDAAGLVQEIRYMDEQP